MRTPTKLMACLLLLGLSVAVYAFCDDKLKDIWQGGCDVGVPAGKSTKTEYNPNPLKACEKGGTNNKRCVTGSVTLLKKVTVYNNAFGCSGEVHSTTGWIEAGGNPYAYDSLCQCP